MIGIYKFITIHGEIYVGYSSDIDKRKKMHYSNHKIKQFDVIEECKKSQLVQREKHWIKYYDSYNNGLNKNKGGGGALFYTIETKLKMSIGRKGKGMGKNQKISDSKKGVSRNITWGDKISEAKTGSPKKGKPILQINPITNKIVNTFSSITEARKIIGSNGIPNALSGISKTSGGYIWKYKE